MPYCSQVGGGGFNGLGTLAYHRPLSYYLGTAATYSILATTVTIGGTCSCNWDVGCFPGVIQRVGFTIGGAVEERTDKAIQAMADLKHAFDYFMGLIATTVLAGDLINRVLTPGVYYTDAAITCTGPMFFNDPTGGGVFIIQMRGGAYTPAAGARSVLQGFARAGNIYWVLDGGALSSGGTANIMGNVISSGAITIGDGGRVDGRILALGGLTLANNIVFST